MRPVVTPTEMAAIDAEAPEPIEQLIARAGWATAQAALDLLATIDRGHAYGKRVVVLAGKGNNGADGRAAVAHLERAGARCRVLPVEALTDRLQAERLVGPHRIDLLIDAAFGTGLSRPFEPDLPELLGQATRTLAVDIPSGVDGVTGERFGRPLRADVTITFAAHKPGLLFAPGRELAGAITVADLGLDCSRASIDLLESDDLSRWPVRAVEDHKWRRAVALVGGSPGMRGAAGLASAAALRAGAGYVRVFSPRSGPEVASHRLAGGGSELPVEAVEQPLDGSWSASVLAEADRFAAVVIGPGLEPDVEEIDRVLEQADGPLVLDAGALSALAQLGPQRARTLRASKGAESPPPVLTPHDGEFRRLTGAAPGADRIDAARALARSFAAVVVLKGPTTVVADPDGRVALSTAGDARLATAGSGDVLAGIIGAGLASGLAPREAAALGVELHGRAARRGPRVGLTAGDLPVLVAQELAAHQNR